MDHLKWPSVPDPAGPVAASGPRLQLVPQESHHLLDKGPPRPKRKGDGNKDIVIATLSFSTPDLIS